jgi:hypothetical protein
LVDKPATLMACDNSLSSISILVRMAATRDVYASAILYTSSRRRNANRSG